MEKQTVTPKLTVVISAFNEELTLARCLKSVAFADEIIVVDNESTDKTVEIAKRHNATVYSQPNRLMLNINKNYGFSKAHGRWILNLDADEEVPGDLATEIQSIVTGPNPKHHGYWVKRKNIIFGAWIRHGIWWPDRQLRLFLANSGKFPCTNIHEYIEIDGGNVGELTHPYNHYNYTSVSQYLRTLDRCTTSEALVLRDTGYRLHWSDAIKFPLSDFLKIYFAQKGYLDGLHGLVLALFQAFYSFVTFAKAWENRGFAANDAVTLGSVNTELSRSMGEMSFWMRQTDIAELKNPLLRIWKRFLGKLSRVFGR